MFTRIVAAGLVLTLSLGCGKKSAKNDTAPADTPPPDAVARGTRPQPRPEVPPNLPAERPNKPNLIGDPRFDQPNPGVGKDPVEGIAPVSDLPQPSAGGENPIHPMPDPMPPVIQPQPPQPQPQPPVAQPQPSAPVAGGKRVTKDDMHYIWIFVENISLASGKMPGPELVYAALLKETPPTAALVKSGAIVLTGARTRESIWAYENGANTRGGWVVTNTGAKQVTAAEFVRLAGGR